MTAHDLVIRNGTVVTASDVFPSDVAIRGEQVAALGYEFAFVSGLDTIVSTIRLLPIS